MTEMRRIEVNILDAQNQIIVRSAIFYMVYNGFPHYSFKHSGTDFLNIQCSQVYSFV